MANISELVHNSRIKVEIQNRRQLRYILGRRAEVWEKVKLLGAGAFGEVNLWHCVEDKRKLRAVKRMKKSTVVDYTRELEAAALFSSRRFDGFFVQSFGWYEIKSYIYLTMEYLPHGDLERYMHGHSFPEVETQRITKQILEALNFMHEENFIHRDLKPQNILVQEKGPDWQVKIGDFGISKRAQESDGTLKTGIGTRIYAAPEVSLEEGSYTRAVDIWSLGVIVFLLATGDQKVFSEFELVDFWRKDIEFPIGRLQAKSVNKSAQAFIVKLLSPDPDSRPSVSDSLDDDWMKGSADVHVLSSYASLESLSASSDEDIPSARWTTGAINGPQGAILQVAPSALPSQSPKPSPEASCDSKQVSSTKTMVIRRSSAPVTTRTTLSNTAQGSDTSQAHMKPKEVPSTEHTATRMTLPKFEAQDPLSKSTIPTSFPPRGADEQEEFIGTHLGSHDVIATMQPEERNKAHEDVRPKPLASFERFAGASKSTDAIRPLQIDADGYIKTNSSGGSKSTEATRPSQTHGNGYTRTDILAGSKFIDAIRPSQMDANGRAGTNSSGANKSINALRPPRMDDNTEMDNSEGSKSLNALQPSQMDDNGYTGMDSLKGSRLLDLTRPSQIDTNGYIGTNKKAAPPQAIAKTRITWAASPQRPIPKTRVTWEAGPRQPVGKAKMTFGEYSQHSLVTRQAQCEDAPQVAKLEITWRQCNSLEGHNSYVCSVAFSPDGRLVATASADTTVWLWDVASGAKLNELSGHSSWVQSVAFSPNGRLIATASWDNTARLWYTATGVEAKQLKGHSDAVRSVAFSPDGRLIGTASWDKTARLWDTATGAELKRLEGHNSSVWSVSFSPDGQLVATASNDTVARLWSTSTGVEVKRLEGHSEPVTYVAFSPDGQLVATASRDFTARLWNTATGEQVKRLECHSNSVWSVSFSPDGRLVATALNDNTARLWDTVTGKELMQLERHSAIVASVAFSPDGTIIATGSWDNKAKLWDIEGTACVRSSYRKHGSRAQWNW